MKNIFWTLCTVALLGAGAPGSMAAPVVRHALVISIDGAHALDLETYVRSKPESTLAAIQKRAITFTNARQPLLGDSTPGLLSVMTGGSPSTTGLIYSPFYDRSLSPPGSGCSSKGSVYYVDEKWVKDMMREDSGGGIDPSKLPRDPSRGCVPVYPHQLMRVNTVFEVVKQAGGRTAWVDQHEMYNDLLRGPTGQGLDESISLERKGVPQTLEGFMGQDARRVDVVLRQIRGLDGQSRQVGVPAVYGMGFITFGAVQKSVGYADGEGRFSPELAKVMDFIDQSLERVVQELKSKKLYDSTAIFITAKHGQSPIDKKQRRVIDRNVIRQIVNSVSPDLLAHASLDSIGLIYLRDPSKAPQVAQALRDGADRAGILRVYAGNSLNLLMSTADSRTPDVIIQPTLGVFYTENATSAAADALLAEHGGMLDEDVQVPLIMSIPGMKPSVNRGLVQTSQIAPTILTVLGLNPTSLKAVQIEGTAVLPGLEQASSLVSQSAPSTAGLYRITTTRTIPSASLPNWDYLAFDEAHSTLYIARREDGILVYSSQSGQLLDPLPNSKGGNAVVLAPDLNRGFVLRLDGVALMFDLKSRQVLRQISFGGDADSGVYDPVTRKIMITRGDSKQVTFLDAQSGDVLGHLSIDSKKIEGAAPVGRGLVMVALRDQNKVLTIDMRDQQVKAEHSTAPSCEQPNGLASDQATRRAFVGCRGAHPVLIVMDTDTGRVVSSTPIGRGNDVVIFDGQERRIYTSNGVDANVVVIDQVDADNYRLAQAVNTRPNARTMAFDSRSKTLFLVAADGAVDPRRAWNKAVAPFYPNTYFKDTFTLLTLSRQ